MIAIIWNACCAPARQRRFCVILTESVFGMDGDLADLARIGALAQQSDALLYVDEAHATGVFGSRGFGLCEDFADVVDVAMGTFGKALGGFGSYLACATDIRDFLIQRCGGLVYSTGLPPAALGAIDAALTLVPAMAAERRYAAGAARNAFEANWRRKAGIAAPAPARSCR